MSILKPETEHKYMYTIPPILTINKSSYTF